MTEQEFQTFLRSIRPADRAAMDAAARRQAELAKPPGSLGALEDVSIRLAGLTGRVKNRIDRCRVLVFAADNGVTAEGVSATPVSVTLSQSINMTRHITGMSALAAAFGDSVVVTDVGIDADVRYPEIVDRKIRRSTGDIAREPAMTREQALTAISVGMEQAQRAAQDGMQAVGIGEMGIGNTTTSAAVLAALTGLRRRADWPRRGPDGRCLPEEKGRDPACAHAAPAGPGRPRRRVVSRRRSEPCGHDGRVPRPCRSACPGRSRRAHLRGRSPVRRAPVPGCAGCDLPVPCLKGRATAALRRSWALRPSCSSACGWARERLSAGLSGAEGRLRRLMNGMATFAEAAINDDYLESIRTPDAFRVDTP